MRAMPQLIGPLSCALVLSGLSFAYAAHNSGESRPSDDRGSQGNQDLIKGDSTSKTGSEKVDDAKLKKDTKKVREEFEKQNAKGRGELRGKAAPMDSPSTPSSGSNLRMQQNSGGTPTNPESSRVLQGSHDPLSDENTGDRSKNVNPTTR